MIKNLAIGSGSNRTFLVLALILGLVSAVLIGVFLSQSRGNGGEQATTLTGPVVVASQDIPALTRVTENMVVVKSLSVDAVLPGAFTEPEAVVGQITQVPVAAGEQILPAKVTATASALQEFGDKTPLSLLIPQGKRAFAIGLTQIAAAGGLVRPGDHVDVILSRTVDTQGQTQLAPAAACYVVQDVEVLAIGETVKRSATEGDVSAIAAAGTDSAAVSATLAVSPDQAWVLAGAQESAGDKTVGNQLWIALRPFGERGESSSLPVCGARPGA
ncbi:MAG: Flp pilus assembly protein CpaB [Dehalococcoidia bacterium]|nr:Flp pilus assembly protein CpaB [Dehalococcoidia bacterium]